MSRIFFAVVASVLLFAGTAIAQIPPAEVRVPYAVCPGIDQGQLCAALEWVQEQRSLPAPAAPTPPTATEREAERRACVSGCPADDAACACRCRGGYMGPQGTCQGLAGTLASLTAVAVNHETRIAELERRAGVTVGTMVGPVTVRRSRHRRPRP